MELSQILEEVNEHYGKAIFVLDSQNSCRASVGDGLVVELLNLPEVDRVIFYSALGAEPQEGRDRVYRLMMRAQYMFRATAGATFAIDEETGVIYLEKPEPLTTLTAESFVSVFETFSKIALQWRDTLVKFMPLAGEAESHERQAENEERMARLRTDQEGFIVA